MKKIKIPLLPRILIAIVLGITFGQFFPVWAVRIFATFNSIFSNFLSFLILSKGRLQKTAFRQAQRPALLLPT